MLEVIILVYTSALPRGTLSTCRSDTPIMGSVHMRLYPFDTVPTYADTKSVDNEGDVPSPKKINS